MTDSRKHLHQAKETMILKDTEKTKVETNGKLMALHNVDPDPIRVRQYSIFFIILCLIYLRKNFIRLCYILSFSMNLRKVNRMPHL